MVTDPFELVMFRLDETHKSCIEEEYDRAKGYNHRISTAPAPLGTDLTRGKSFVNFTKNHKGIEKIFGT